MVVVVIFVVVLPYFWWQWLSWVDVSISNGNRGRWPGLSGAQLGLSDCNAQIIMDCNAHLGLFFNSGNSFCVVLFWAKSVFSTNAVWQCEIVRIVCLQQREIWYYQLEFGSNIDKGAAVLSTFQHKTSTIFWQKSCLPPQTSTARYAAKNDCSLSNKSFTLSWPIISHVR